MAKEDEDMGFIIPEIEKEKFFDIENIILKNYSSKKISEKIFKISNQEEDWKIPDKLPDLPQPPEEAKPRTTQTKQHGSRAQALKYLDSVFIDDALKDDIITRTAIPDLLEGTEPAYTGVILFGPPGTGKTVLLRAIGNVYQASGAYAKEVSVSSVNSSFVGQFAKNLEEQIQIALREAKRRGKPSFLYFDEGSILAQNAAEGADSVSKHYQETIDVMKRYIGNDRNLIAAISTNLLSESFEDALTREGRLTSFFIGYPDAEQRKRMWKHFAGEYKVMALTDEQAYRLAEATPAEQGAFIEEFCRNYRRARRAVILKEKGYNSLVDALKHSANITDDEVTSSTTFDNLYADLGATLKAKYERIKEKQENGGEHIGFRP